MRSDWHLVFKLYIWYLGQNAVCNIFIQTSLIIVRILTNQSLKNKLFQCIQGKTKHCWGVTEAKLSGWLKHGHNYSQNLFLYYKINFILHFNRSLSYLKYLSFPMFGDHHQSL